MVNYKKASFWITVFAIICLGVLLAVYLTSTSDNGTVSDLEGVDFSENVVVIPSEEKAKALKEMYPEYFDFKSDDTIDVNIWQTAEGAFYCFAVAHDELPEDLDSLLSSFILGTLHPVKHINPVPVEDMKYILAYQQISRTQIRLIPSENPAEDYSYPIDDEFTEKAEDAFWKGYGTLKTFTSYVMASAEYDFDGDGVKESITMTPGPTSGIYTFVLNITGGYRDTFHAMDYHPKEFVVTGDGCFLECEPSLNKKGESNRLYRITIEKGTIVLRYGEESFWQWGI